MAAVKLEHSNLAQHQSSILTHLQTFWKEGQLCDIVLKSQSGTEHRAHTAVLCAASVYLKNMLLGPFREANQVQQGQPVEIAASDAVVLALLEYIYGGQPEVELEDAVELMHLADAFNFQELSAALAPGLHESLETAPVATALKMLPHIQDLHEVKAACEKKVAANFETCIELVEFLELGHGQLGRILRRQDLKVTREEVVLKGLLNWFNRSKQDRGIFLGLLLQHIDFRSLSSSNLTLCARLLASMGLDDHDVQGEVAEALLAQRKHSAARYPDAFWPRRRCLQHWSPDLGASSQFPQKVLPPGFSMCCHNDDAIYYCGFSSSTVFKWTPADNESQAIAGWSTQVDEENRSLVSVCPSGDFLVLDLDSDRLLKFENASATVVLSGHKLESVFCSPNGVVYVLTHNGQKLQKVVGATLQPLISSEHLPAHLEFNAYDLFVNKEEVVYISDNYHGRILRIKPGGVEPVVLGEAPNTETAELQGLFVTEDEKIYVADYGQWKVWAFYPGTAAWTEVLTCPGWLRPVTVIVRGGSLYVSMVDDASVEEDAGGVYEYLLPPELQLE